MIDKDQKNTVTTSQYVLMLLIGIVIFIPVLIITISKYNAKTVKPCDPLPIIDGYRSVRVKNGDFTLKLPSYAAVLQRRRVEDQKCEFDRSLTIDYLWYESKLISEGINRFKVPYDETVKVRIYFRGSGLIDKARESYLNDPVEIKRPWRFDGAIPHKRFPLEYYPKAAWDDPDNPSETALHHSRLDSAWGIRGTKYRNPIHGRLFTASCSIRPLREDEPASRVESDFSHFGDSKCRGWITAAKDGKYISFMVDVWAYLNKRDGSGVMEINHIYDAIVEEAQAFIQ